MKYFLTNEVEFEFPKEDRDREREDKFDAGYVPDIAKLADGLKSCFQVNPVLTLGKRRRPPRLHHPVRRHPLQLRHPPHPLGRRPLLTTLRQALTPNPHRPELRDAITRIGPSRLPTNSARTLKSMFGGVRLRR